MFDECFEDGGIKKTKKNVGYDEDLTLEELRKSLPSLKNKIHGKKMSEVLIMRVIERKGRSERTVFSKFHRRNLIFIIFSDGHPPKTT